MSNVKPVIRGEVASGALVRLLRIESSPTIEEVWSAVGEAARDVDLGQRRRFYLREIATGVETYLHVFAPTADWTLAEGPELTWVGNGGVFADRLVLSSREAEVWTHRTKGLPRRMVSEGRTSHGDRFLGVRMVMLTAPGRSLLVHSPTTPPMRLADTQLWFAAPLLRPSEIVEIVAGGGQ